MMNFARRNSFSGKMRVRVRVSMRKLFHQCLVRVCVYERASVICGNTFHAPQTSEKRSNQILSSLFAFAFSGPTCNHNKLIQMENPNYFICLFYFSPFILCGTLKSKTRQKAYLLSIPRWSTFCANISIIIIKFV